jgi:folate-binding protein YgfZ
LSTADVKNLQPGQGCSTVVTNAKGRIVERLSVHHQGEDGVLLIAGEDGAARTLAHLAKYTFSETTGLSDVTAATYAYVLIGPRWPDAARTVQIRSSRRTASCRARSRDSALTPRGRTVFGADGILVTGPLKGRDSVSRELMDAATAEGGGEIDAQGLEAWRILKCLPSSGHELTEEHNPLEAGLRDAVSFTKGCYVGQEVVARLNTYDKVARTLVRLDLEPGAPAPSRGAAVLHDGREVGAVTSAIHPTGRAGAVALAYVKSRAIPAGTTVVGIADAGTTRTATIATS